MGYKANLVQKGHDSHLLKFLMWSFSVHTIKNQTSKMLDVKHFV